MHSRLVATRQKSSCNLATSKGESRDSGSALSLPRAAVERLGLEAWRRIEPEEIQLGTCSRAGVTELAGTDTKKIKYDHTSLSHCLPAELFWDLCCSSYCAISLEVSFPFLDCQMWMPSEVKGRY